MALTKVSNSMLVQPVNHNLIINPSFTVKQRGDVIDHNTESYGHDRWKVRGLDAVGGTMSQSSTVVDPTTGINKLLVKHRNAEGYSRIYQYIEAVNLQGLYNKEMTFSFGYSDVGGSGIPKVEIMSWDSSGIGKELFNTIPTSLGDNRWTCTVTLSTNDGTIPDLSERGMTVVIYPNEQSVAPSEWYVWETKLEAGSVVTPFIARSHGEELALCQRYFLGKLTFRMNMFTTAVDQRLGGCMYFPVQMRSLPTVLNAGGSSNDQVEWSAINSPSTYSCRTIFLAKTPTANADISCYADFDAEL